MRDTHQHPRGATVRDDLLDLHLGELRPPRRERGAELLVLRRVPVLGVVHDRLDVLAPRRRRRLVRANGDQCAVPLSGELERRTDGVVRRRRPVGADDDRAIERLPRTAHHHDRAGRVGRDALADRAEHEAAEPAATPVANDQQFGVLRRVEQRRDGLADRHVVAHGDLRGHLPRLERGRVDERLRPLARPLRAGPPFRRTVPTASASRRPGRRAAAHPADVPRAPPTARRCCSNLSRPCRQRSLESPFPLPSQASPSGSPCGGRAGQGRTVPPPG